MHRPEDDLGFVIARTHRTMVSDLCQYLRPLGISFEQFQVLLGLSIGDGVPQHVLATRLCLEPSSIARMLVRMEKAGLVYRTRHLQDRRVRSVHVTEKGREMWEKVKPVQGAWLTAILADLSPDEVQQMHRLLGRILARLNVPPIDGQ